MLIGFNNTLPPDMIKKYLPKLTAFAILLTWLFPLESSAQNVPNGSTTPTSTARALPAAYSGANLNYIRVYEPNKPVSDAASVANLSTVEELRRSTQYFDGLGRPIQTVGWQVSPAKQDLVSPVTYDEMGRERFKYLPYVSPGSDGSFKTSPFSEQASFMGQQYPTEQVYYSETVFEASPLNRVLKTLAPGNSWGGSGRGVSNGYGFNAPGDSVVIWNTGSGQYPVSGGYYEANTLYRDEVTDENGNKVVTYKDKSGQVILKKVEINANNHAYTGWLCTYYIYDDLGRMVFVIPPKAVEAIKPGWNLSDNTLRNELCFSYSYDERNRMVTKKVPGSAMAEMVYDKRDRLVFSRDGNLLSKGQWLVTFYDELNRPVETALYNNSASRATLQAGMNAAVASSEVISYGVPLPADLSASLHDGRTEYKASHSISFLPGFEADGAMEAYIDTDNGAYTTTVNVSNPLPDLDPAQLYPLTFTFYDDYTYNGKHPFQSNYLSKIPVQSSEYPETVSAASTKTKGLVTGMMTRVLGTDQWLVTSTYYDDKARAIQVASTNVSGGVDYVTNRYDFSGKVLGSYLHQLNQSSSAVAELKVLTRMRYDHSGRLLSVYKQLNDAGELKRIDTLTYDALGQLKTKELGDGLETLDYGYNIRGWLDGINRDYASSGSGGNYFGMELYYDHGYTDNQYNGNISGTIWRSAGDNEQRSYGFGYDMANRLKKADFTQYTGGAWNTSAGIDFSVSNLGYDGNGNILSLSREGLKGSASNTVDELSYSYYANSNKLKSVTDAVNDPSSALGDFKEANSGQARDYDYDANGNLRYDANKEIDSIRYNILNLPEYIRITGKGTISYRYDASGMKLRKTVTDNTVSPAKVTVTDYLGGSVYQNDTLQFMGHEEGRIRAVFTAGNPVDYVYDYFVKDHLGNVRVVLTEQTDFSMYAATMETENAATENALFSNIDASRSANPSGYPAASSTNKQVAKLNANNEGSKIGPSLVLKVMAGDTISIAANAFYKSVTLQEQAAANIETDIVPALLNALGGAASQDALKGSGIASSPITSDFYNNAYQRLRERDNGDNNTDRPKAYLNFVMFDEKYNLEENHH